MPGPDSVSATAGSPLPSPSAPQSNVQLYALPREKEACFVMWDIENCPLPARGPFSNGHHLVQRMRNVFLQFGVIKDIRAYTDMTSLSKELRGQLQASGVHLIDVPQRRKDAADKMILADLILFAVDNHPPATVVLISGDRDYAYALAKLAQRRYRMVLVVPPQGVNDELRLQANVVLEWRKGDTVLPEAEVQSGTRYAVPIPTYFPIEREEELAEGLAAAAASAAAGAEAPSSPENIGTAEAKRLPSSTTPHPQGRHFSMPAPLGTPIRSHPDRETAYFANPPLPAPTAEREPPSSSTFARLKKTNSATPVDTNLPHDLPNPPTPTFPRSNSPTITRLNSPSVSRSNSPTLAPTHPERSTTLPALALGAVSANSSQLSVPSVDSARKRPSTPSLESAGGSAEQQGFGDESDTSEVGISSYYAPLLAVISRYLQDTSRKEMEYAAIGEELRKWSPKWMDDLNVKRLKDYVSQAEAAGVIKVRREGVQNYVSLPMSDDPPLLVRGRSNQVSASVEAQDARHLELLLRAVEALDKDSIVPSRKHIEARLRELGVRNTDWFPHVVMLAVSSHRLEAFAYGPDYAYYSTSIPNPAAGTPNAASSGSSTPSVSASSSPTPLTPRKSALSASASNLGIHWDPDIDYDEKGFTHDEWKALGEYLVANPSTAARGRYPLARKLQAEAGEAIRSMPFGKMICLIQTAVSHARWLEFRGHSLVVAHKVMDCSHCHNRDKVPLVVEHPVGGLRWQALCSQCHRQYARDQFSPSSHVHTTKSPVTATIQQAAPQPSPQPSPTPSAASSTGQTAAAVPAAAKPAPSSAAASVSTSSSAVSSSSASSTTAAASVGATSSAPSSSASDAAVSKK